jgi:hypothetical protein
MSLEQHLDHLLTQYAPASRLEDVQLVEVGADDYDGSGLPIVRQASLAEPAAYAARFSKLLASGYSWLNLSFYGLLDGRPLIAVELPRGGVNSATTSVNYSGPSKAIADAGGDARAGVALR